MNWSSIICVSFLWVCRLEASSNQLYCFVSRQEYPLHSTRINNIYPWYQKRINKKRNWTTSELLLDISSRVQCLPQFSAFNRGWSRHKVATMHGWFEKEFLSASWFWVWWRFQKTFPFLEANNGKRNNSDILNLYVSIKYRNNRRYSTHRRASRSEEKRREIKRLSKIVHFVVEQREAKKIRFLTLWNRTHSLFCY